MAFPANIDLSSLTGGLGSVLYTGSRGDAAGYAVAAGDINGDGFSDLIVGGPQASPNGSYSGITYVIFGKSTGFGSSTSLANLNGVDGFKLNGVPEGSVGESVASIGDLNGDGYDDLIVGASAVKALQGSSTSNPGASYVVFGKASGFPSTIELSSLNGSNGFKLAGVGARDMAGADVAAAGDVNNDGYDDIIVGASWADPNGRSSGASYVVFGKGSGFGANFNLSALDGSNGFKISGAAQGDQAGVSVSSAGDVNGDGFDDLLIGATYADAPGFDTGASYVVFGRRGGFSANVELSSLNGTNGFKLSGVAAFDQAGFSVAAGGDVNGDGIDDLIVAAPAADPHGLTSGASYVVFGTRSGFAANINLSALNGANGFKLSGALSGDQSGRVASAGDFNGDGYDDLLIGAPGADPNGSISGATYLVFGKATGFTANIDLSSLNGTNGFKLSGESTERSGFSVSSAGDVNGDGYDDLIVGAPYNVSSGRAYVIYGRADGPAIGSAAADVLTGANGNDVLLGGGGADQLRGMAGNDWLAVKDLTFSQADGGTGRDTLALDGSGLVLDLANPTVAARLQGIEVIELTGTGDNTLIVSQAALLGGGIGAMIGDKHVLIVAGNAGDKLQFSELGWKWAGSFFEAAEFANYDRWVFGDAEVRVRSGTISAANSELARLDGATGFKLNGVAATDQSGISVASAGDVNGDGFADMIVGAFYAGSSDAGASYVVFGKASGFATDFNLSALNGSNGFKLSGGAANDHSGRSVASAGDVNGDGFADVIVGAPDADPNGSGSGASYVVFGKASGFAANLNLSTLDGSNGVKLTGGAVNEGSGRSVASAGDFNGDGIADIIVAPRAASVGAAASYVVFGKASGLAATTSLATLDGSNGFRLTGLALQDYNGISVASAGDVNGDGLDELLVGAPSGSASNASYVVFGRASGMGPSFDLSTLDGSNGFKLSGPAWTSSGVSVASAGDVNGDGFADLIIGALHAGYSSDGSGASYVVFGKAAGFDANINLSALNGSNGFKLTAAALGDTAGRSVASAGDFNGDGYDDLIIGAPGADQGGEGSGTTYIVFGKAAGFAASIDLASLGTNAGLALRGEGESGRSVASAGDVNKDGFDDLIIGARLASSNGVWSGTSYVVFGGAHGGSSLPVTTSGTAAAEILVGGLGNDLLAGGGGADVFHGGAGNDRMVVADLTFRLADGGNGIDTLVLDGDGLTLDLTSPAIAARLEGIERIDLSGSGNNTLIVNQRSVLGGIGATANGKHILVVERSAGDTVQFAEGGWAKNGSLADGSRMFDRWILGNAEVQVEQDTGVVIVGTAGNDAISTMATVPGQSLATGLADIIDGAAGDDVLDGGGGNDALYGGADNDTLIGGTAAAGGTNQLWGGTGSDTASYVGTTGAVHADLAAQAGYVGGVLIDQMNSIENLTGGSGNDVLVGDDGNNVLSGGLGNDALYGQGGDDVLIGGAALAGGTNQLWGGTGSDTASYVGTTGSVHADLGGQAASVDGVLVDQMNSVENLIGGSGNDMLVGGAGANVLAGRAGNDTYVVDSLDTVVEAAGEGIDTVNAAIDWTLGANFENLVLTGTANLKGTGNGLANALTGTAGNNLLDGGAGADTMTGGLGDDTYVVDSIADIVVEEAGGGIDTVLSSVIHTLQANVENLTLTGTDAIDGTGNALDNWLTGNAAANTLSGGLGNDTYVVDSLDTIVEAASQGTDTVRTSLDYTLGTNLENLVLTGTANVAGTGNGLANLLTGNAGNNLLDGGAGADTMTGGLGDDTYVVGSVTDLVIEEAGGGIDTVRSSVSYTLTTNVEKLVLIGGGTLSGTGNALANSLTGGDGVNVLDGGAGADTMAGGLGNDTYVVDDAGDLVVEAANEGVDTVRAWIDHTLAANVEKIVLQGTAHLKGTGNALDNSMTGNAGNNLLDGGAGADTMVGGLGDDTYIVDNAGDVASEEAAGGVDTVRSSVSLRLRPHVENLVLTGTDGINGTGNELANVLTGNTANNMLDGGVGDDTMTGGLGDDTYVLDVATDKVTELAGQGTDTVQVSFTYVLRTNFENVTLTGSAAVSAVGNTVANVLIGNAGANVLDGRAGADTMQGGAGDDTYYVENAGDVVIEAVGKGTDSVKAWIDYTLGDHVEKLVLQGTENLNGTGNALDNALVGNAGNNVLDGGAGADTMSGEAGDDTYFIDNAGDRASEDAGEGFDTLYASVAYVLRPNLERLVLTGTADINGVGNAANNILDGNDGNNTLDGGAGADEMAGGLGDDKYVVENAGDVVVELSDQGIDSVRSWISYTLGANLEKLTLYGTANLGGTGNELVNTVIGNSGHNVLDGGLGSDTLSGEGGGDTFRFSTALGPDNVDRILAFDHASDTVQLDDSVFVSLGTGGLTAGAFNTGAVATQADDRILFDAASKSLYYDADGAGGVAAIKFATISTLTGPLDHTDFFVV